MLKIFQHILLLLGISLILISNYSFFFWYTPQPMLIAISLFLILGSLIIDEFTNPRKKWKRKQK